MLACSRIGAIHSVVFGGFAPESLKNRIEDCQSTFLITANEGVRGGKKIPLLKNVKEAVENLKIIKHTIVVKRTESKEFFDNLNDTWYHELISNQKDFCEVEPQDPKVSFIVKAVSALTAAFRLLQIDRCSQSCTVILGACCAAAGSQGFSLNRCIFPATP